MPRVLGQGLEGNTGSHMQIGDEEHRLYNFRNGEEPTSLFTILRFWCQEPESCISRVTSVMASIAQFSPEDWPEDAHWEQVLPDWLLNTFRTYTPQEIQEILADKSTWANLDWMFDSWLERMKERCWRWWSLKQSQESITITLAIDGDPCPLTAFKHLVKAAGGRLLTED